MIFFFLLIIIIIGVVAYFVHSNSQSSYDSHTYTYTREDDVRPEPKSRPKISAELNDELYSEVRTYCSNHSMTVSDLIRKSVKAYIDNN